MPKRAFRRAAIGALPIVALLGFAPSAGAAERSAAPGVRKLDLLPMRSDWVKVCFKDAPSRKEVCYTTRDFAEEPETPILSLEVFDFKGEDGKLLRLMTPLGLALKPGFRFAVDKGRQEAGAFEVCFPSGCYADAKTTTAAIDAMKKGEKLLIAVKKISGEELTFQLPLAGFGRIYDGPGDDPKTVEAEQKKKLQEELQKRVEEEKKKEAEAAAAPRANPAPSGFTPPSVSPAPPPPPANAPQAAPTK
jgi:invasion protein IalB